MLCPFRYRRRNNWSPGADPDFMEFIEWNDIQAERSFDERFPSCWAKFLHWLGVR